MNLSPSLAQFDISPKSYTADGSLLPYDMIWFIILSTTNNFYIFVIEWKQWAPIPPEFFHICFLFLLNCFGGYFCPPPHLLYHLFSLSTCYRSNLLVLVQAGFRLLLAYIDYCLVGNTHFFGYATCWHLISSTPCRRLLRFKTRTFSPWPCCSTFFGVQLHVI